MGIKYIDQIFIYGYSLENYLIAFIYPTKILLFDNINEENYINHLDHDEIIKRNYFHGRNNALKGFELPKKIYIKEPFSIENQIITLLYPRGSSIKHPFNSGRSTYIIPISIIIFYLLDLFASNQMSYILYFCIYKTTDMNMPKHIFKNYIRT